MTGHHHMPHLFGTKHHKPIDPTSPVSPSHHEPNQKLAKQLVALHDKAEQPHVHYEEAAKGAQKEQDERNQLTEAGRDAALKAARMAA